MLISCPNCKTTFAIPAKNIGATGRKVKCSKCAHIWMQEPINFDDEKLNTLLKVESKGPVNLPAIIKKEKFKFAYAISAAVLILLATTLQVMKTPKEYPGFAQKLGIDNYEGLRFHKFKVESEIVDTKLDFYLKGEIVNVTDKTIKLPIINVKAFSKGGRVMAQSSVKLPQDSLEPFSKLEISPEITKISGNAEKLELSFENWLEAALR